MPTIDENLFGVAKARVSNRLYPVTAPPTPTAPYAIFQCVSSIPQTDLADGKGQLLHSRYQVDVFDPDRANARATCELIAADICSSSLFKAIRASAPIDFGYEEEVSLYRMSQDFYIWHS
jgi:hypothetical protein